MLFELQKWDAINEQVVLLTKRRSQLKTVSNGKVGREEREREGGREVSNDE